MLSCRALSPLRLSELCVMTSMHACMCHQDLLWRARVTSEISLIKQTEANNAAAREAVAAARRVQASRAQAAMNKKVLSINHQAITNQAECLNGMVLMMGFQNYTLEEELELKRVVDQEARKSRKEKDRLRSERRARLEAQKKV